MMVVNNNGIYGGLDNDLYYEITNEAEQPSSITRQDTVINRTVFTYGQGRHLPRALGSRFSGAPKFLDVSENGILEDF